MSTDLELTEAGIRYLDSLEPAERDAYYQALQVRKNRKPAESLDSLTERMAELGKNRNQNQAELNQVRAEINRRLELNAEHQLRLFIADQIENGGVVNIGSVKMKAKALGLPHVDVTRPIKEVGDIQRSLAEQEERIKSQASEEIKKAKDDFWEG